MKDSKAWPFPPPPVNPETVHQPEVLSAPPQSLQQPTITELTTKQTENVVHWTQARLELLKATIARDLNNEQFALFVEVCKSRRLNPFTKQIHAVIRGGVMTIQTAIDGYRLIADRSGLYRGQTPPYWCGKDGVWTDVWTKNENPFVAKIGVHKQGFPEPLWGMAYWDTYANPGPFWKKAGAHMLSKCAEALALKKAFPEELSGLYTDDEMDQAGNGTMVTVMPVSGAEVAQPFLIFPAKIINEWNTETAQYVLAADTAGQEWLFTGEAQFGALDKALKDSSPLQVYFKVELNRRVVTSVE